MGRGVGSSGGGTSAGTSWATGIAKAIGKAEIVGIAIELRVFIPTALSTTTPDSEVTKEGSVDKGWRTLPGLAVLKAAKVVHVGII